MATALAIIQQDEKSFRAVADAAPVMLWTADPQGDCNFFNARWLRFAGLAHHELVGDGWTRLLHPHDRARHLRRYEHAVQKRLALSLDSRLKRADGAWRWMRIELVPQRAPRGMRSPGFVGTAVDITDYREAQHNLEHTLALHTEAARALALRLGDVQESERRRLSAELHDRAGEPLTALRLQLAALLSMDLPAGVRSKLEDCVGHTGRTLDAVAGVMSELRPPMLDDVGLAAALRWYAGHVRSSANLEIELSVPQEPPRLPPQVESALFRIAQECLRNIVRHAHASHAEVTLSHEGGRGATLRIEDDGVGFASGLADQPSRWGILTMRERACAIGARLDIVSEPGAGASITVTLPE